MPLEKETGPFLHKHRNRTVRALSPEEKKFGLQASFHYLLFGFCRETPKVQIMYNNAQQKIL